MGGGDGGSGMGNGNGKDVPVWAKLIATVGVPSAIVLLLLGAFDSLGIRSPITRIENALKDSGERTAAAIGLHEVQASADRRLQDIDRKQMIEELKGLRSDLYATRMRQPREEIRAPR